MPKLPTVTHSLVSNLPPTVLCPFTLTKSTARDDSDAIDQSNIIEGRTRGAAPSGGYREPGDEEGLPGPEDGTSSVA